MKYMLTVHDDDGTHNLYVTGVYGANKFARELSANERLVEVHSLKSVKGRLIIDQSLGVWFDGRQKIAAWV